MKYHEMLAKFALIANEFDLLWENLVFGVFFLGGGLDKFVISFLNCSIHQAYFFFFGYMYP